MRPAMPRTAERIPPQGKHLHPAHRRQSRALFLEWRLAAPVPSAPFVLEAALRPVTSPHRRSSWPRAGPLRQWLGALPPSPVPSPFACALQPGYALLTWSRLAQSANPILNSRRSPHRSSSEERWQGAGRTRRSCLFLGGEKRRAQTQPGGSIVRQGEDRSRAWCALEINEHEKKTNGVVFVSPPTTSSSQLPCMRRGPRFRFRPRSGRLAAAIT